MFNPSPFVSPFPSPFGPSYPGMQVQQQPQQAMPQPPEMNLKRVLNYYADYKYYFTDTQETKISCPGNRKCLGTIFC